MHGSRIVLLVVRADPGTADIRSGGGQDWPPCSHRDNRGDTTNGAANRIDQGVNVELGIVGRSRSAHTICGADPSTVDHTD